MTHPYLQLLLQGYESQKDIVNYPDRLHQYMKHERHFDREQTLKPLVTKEQQYDSSQNHGLQTMQT